MERTSKLDGDDRDQGLHAVTDNPAVSRSAAGEPVQLGEAVSAVVLRIRNGLPRLSLAPIAWEECEDRDQL